MRHAIVAIGIVVGVGTVSAVGFAEQPLSIDSGHKLLEESRAPPAVPIDSVIGDLWFRDLKGNTFYLHQRLEEGPIVFVFLSTKCPSAKRYTQRLNRLAGQFSNNGVSLFGVFSNADETREGIADYAAKAAYAFPVVKDVTGYLARRVGATMTPQALVLDRSGVLRYRGAIDDNRYEDRVRHHYLQQAIAAVLSSLDVPAAQTETLGCTIHLPDAESVSDVTYATHIARILQDNCQTCHRPGQVAPFALTNFEEARTWGTEIKAYTQARLMPPWKPEPGIGEFKEVRALSPQELSLVARWVDGGMPEGDLADLPPPAQFNDQWSLGQPDLIVEMPDQYKIGPEGEDDYRHFIIPVTLDRDQYVEAIDVQPGNRATVHHVIAYVDTSGKARELDAADPGLGYTRFGGVGFDAVSMLGGWAPGQRPSVLPKRTGLWLPKECDIVLQVHYFRTGVWETDRTRVGLYFSKTTKPVKAHYGLALNTKFTIPPGESNYRVEGRLPDKQLKEPIWLISVYPHMHLLGKEIKVTAIFPDGKELPLIWIKNWDFNWQSPYAFKVLHYLPAGSRIQVVSYFDNSANNPNNPHDPPIPVGWGEKTTDEMCLSFFTYLKAADYSPELASGAAQ